MHNLKGQSWHCYQKNKAVTAQDQQRYTARSHSSVCICIFACNCILGLSVLTIGWNMTIFKLGGRLPQIAMSLEEENAHIQTLFSGVNGEFHCRMNFYLEKRAVSQLCACNECSGIALSYCACFTEDNGQVKVHEQASGNHWKPLTACHSYRIQMDGLGLGIATWLRERVTLLDSKLVKKENLGFHVFSSFYFPS